MEEIHKKSHDDSILGFSTTELAGLSLEDLTGNETAIRMMVHYYKKLVDDNNSLKNDNNTLKTYVDAYQKQKTNSSTGAVLLFASNISIGFGVNLLTSNSTWPGVASLISGLTMAAAGLYFNFFKDRN